MNVLICSRKDMEKMIINKSFPQKTAVISFYDPSTEHIKFDRVCCDVYYCPFEDIDVWSAAEFEEQSVQFDFADDLAEFIYKAYDNDQNIICQCDHGQSRSAGCAAAILQHFYGSGLAIFTDYNYCPNKVVYHNVYNALRAYRPEKK